MKVSFVLPNNSDHPIGGYKVIYEYANMFAANGDEVTINFTLYDKVPNECIGLRGVLGKVKRNILYHLGILVSSKKTVTWFNLDNRIKLNFVLPQDKYFPDSDVVVATAWTTAYTVNQLSVKKGAKVYFIQHDERIFGPSEFVKPTWLFDMKRIVVASWLKDMLYSEEGLESEVVKNFVNIEEFDISNSLAERKHVVSMLNHNNPFKGTADGIEVLKKVHDEIPDLEVRLFGTPDKPENLPNYFSYTHNATAKELKKLYNESAIYLFPSHIEGWGLTATEAMMCGVALVSAKNGGVNDFGINQQTALLSEVGDKEQMSKDIVCLLKNKYKRIMIAENGYNFVSKMTKDESFLKFNFILTQLIS
ncbi:glycosyltransferase family 4 protein [Leuconostoc carnosum]|uniref:glycosyltransferase family 4 protein n=1 Tax=Leuconostoc carnosum TaxID=1252 RepID=UPI001238FA91|nr:glycosyltransferase family 4 protein [Leuconostoc carnosum]KAA8368005.1 glycosyltransferase family 4 protein [Leuconostoc carnosum]